MSESDETSREFRKQIKEVLLDSTKVTRGLGEITFAIVNRTDSLSEIIRSLTHNQLTMLTLLLDVSTNNAVPTEKFTKLVEEFRSVINRMKETDDKFREEMSRGRFK